MSDNTYPHLILVATNGIWPKPKVKATKRKRRLGRSSLQVKKDLEQCSYALRVTWIHKLNRARAIAHQDGHQLDVWSARHRLIKGKNKPQFFVAVCKRCRGVFIVERAHHETYWLFPYGTCRAVPRKVIRVGGKIMLGGETMVKIGYKRKFV